jgi:type IV pilus assembly protein PilF
MTKIIFILLFLPALLLSCSSLEPGASAFDKQKAAETRVSLGLTYLKNGNFSQAKFNLDKAFEYAPRSADVNFALAYYYQQVEEIETAREKYLLAMDLAPENADIANSYGAFLCEIGDYSQAKVYFLKAINTTSYGAAASTYQNLALCSERAGQQQEAVEYLKKAVNHQPNEPSSLLMLSQALIKSEQWDEARKTLRHYEKLSQVSPDSLLAAIEIETGSGNVELAKEYQNMVLKVYPEAPQVKAWQAQRQQSVAPEQAKNITTTTAKSIKTLKPQTPEQGDVFSTEQLLNAPDEVTGTVSGGKKNVKYHTVAQGENLYRISLLYNIKMQRLIEWNELSDSAAISTGMKLKIFDDKSEE